jgi:hypothetical protein
MAFVIKKYTVRKICKVQDWICNFDFFKSKNMSTGKLFFSGYSSCSGNKWLRSGIFEDLHWKSGRLTAATP